MGANMKNKKQTIQKIQTVETECYVIKIYLKHHKFCKFKSIPLDEEEVNQFLQEMNDPNLIMEFDTFCFNKNSLDYYKVKKVIVKTKQIVEIKKED